MVDELQSQLNEKHSVDTGDDQDSEDSIYEIDDEKPESGEAKDKD